MWRASGGQTRGSTSLVLLSLGGGQRFGREKVWRCGGIAGKGNRSDSDHGTGAEEIQAPAAQGGGEGRPAGVARLDCGAEKDDPFRLWTWSVSAGRRGSWSRLGGENVASTREEGAVSIADSPMRTPLSDDEARGLGAVTAIVHMSGAHLKKRLRNLSPPCAPVPAAKLR